jgi:hypothetical protein
MDKIKQLLQSRKFWALVASLVAIWGGYYTGGVTLLEAVQATVAALGLYSVGTGLDNGQP